MLQGFVRPVTINSGSNLYAVKMKNVDYVRNNVVPKLIELVSNRIEVTTESYGKITASVFLVGQGPWQSWT